MFAPAAALQSCLGRSSDSMCQNDVPLTYLLGAGIAVLGLLRNVGILRSQPVEPSFLNGDLQQMELQWRVK